MESKICLFFLSQGVLSLPKSSSATRSQTVDVRKKTKYVPLFGEDGKSTTSSKLPGDFTSFFSTV